MKIPIHNIHVRKATGNDADAVCRLYHETVTSLDRGCYTNAQIEKFASVCREKNNWEQKITNDHYLLATDRENNIYGFCSLQADGCIDMLYVHPAHQHMGVASSLLIAIYDLADESHIHFVYANISLSAIPFYEKNGFTVRDISPKDIEGVHFTNVVVDKRLWLM